tara:strand:- start:1536 stop:1913 length:378 start_codon:yes stop_codon:yes gene_type:complete
MSYKYIMILWFGLSGSAMGHQFTPTYPKLEQSYVTGVLKATMYIFNSRQDVKYYEFSVYDANFKPVQFATTEKIVAIPYLGKKTIEIFIRSQDKNRVVYICSKSKMLKGRSAATVVSSRICSKIK